MYVHIVNPRDSNHNQIHIARDLIAQFQKCFQPIFLVLANLQTTVRVILGARHNDHMMHRSHTVITLKLVRFQVVEQCLHNSGSTLVSMLPELFSPEISK